MCSSFNIIFSKPVKNFQTVLQPFYCFFSLFFFLFLDEKIQVPKVLLVLQVLEVPWSNDPQFGKTP